MGEACKAMETLMVCGDYRHAGMMSCTGCVCVRAYTSAQILYNMSVSLHICKSVCMHLVIEYTMCVCVCVRLCLHSVRVRGCCL